MENSDTSAFIHYVKSKSNISPDTEQALKDNLEIKHYQKQDLLLKEGQIARYLFFAISGTVRTFYYHDGKDITSWIYPETIPFTAWSSFITQNSSFEYIEVLEPSIILSIQHENLLNLYKEHPSLERFGRLMVEEQFSFIDWYSKGYMFMTAKEKYEALLNFFPDVTLRVNLGHVASLLGITQETLSRIRAKR